MSEEKSTVDQIFFDSKINVPAAENEQKLNERLEFDENDKIVFSQNIIAVGNDAWTIGKNILGGRDNNIATINNGRKISKPAAQNEILLNKRYNLVSENGEDAKLEEVKGLDKSEGWSINGENVLGFRGEYKDNNNSGNMTGDGSRNKTNYGETTNTESFVYNGGLTSDDNGKTIPGYFDRKSPGYTDKDFEPRVNATYIVEGMAVNQLRSTKNKK